MGFACDDLLVGRVPTLLTAPSSTRFEFRDPKRSSAAPTYVGKACRCRLFLACRGGRVEGAIVRYGFNFAEEPSGD